MEPTNEQLKPLINWLMSMQAPLPTRHIETIFFPGGAYTIDILKFSRNNNAENIDTQEFCKNPTISLIDLIHAGVVTMNVHSVVPYRAQSEAPEPVAHPTGDTKGRIGQERKQRSGESFDPRRYDKLGVAPLGTTYVTSTGGVYVSHAGENPFSPEYWLEVRAPGG